jgi:hypothetical protein
VVAGDSIVETAADGDTDVVSVATTTDMTPFTAASFDNIEGITFATTVNATVSSAQMTGETIALTGVAGGAVETLTINMAIGGTGVFTGLTATNSAVAINGASGAETITASAAGGTITALAGADNITGGAGTDTIVTAATAALNGDDNIGTFTNNTDILNIDAFLDATAMNAALAANPGGATVVTNDVNPLVDIAGGQDVTTAAGLNTALAAGGEYANINMGNNALAVFATASTNAAGQDQHIFFATSDGAGAITAVQVAVISGLDINNFVAADFNI